MPILNVNDSLCRIVAKLFDSLMSPNRFDDCHFDLYYNYNISLFAIAIAIVIVVLFSVGKMEQPATNGRAASRQATMAATVS
jgi:ABC-type enterochelin transport system permease subunit